MERRGSLNGRLSSSTTNISGPLAESTQINGVNLQAKFPWGGKASPHKKGGPSCSIIERTIPKAMPSVRKIDPRIYTDVQSKGLTSRIVKYHEHSSKLNRSMSVGNLYNKPGQFPVIHLKRNEISYKPRRNQSISMVRIAPPEKSVLQANTRLSILKTGSMVPSIGLERTDERDARANKPIVPPAENDLNPTRSVLDALKEISRKRINSDDVDCNDSIKKYCKETEEVVRRNLHLPLQNISAAHVSVITKRQREIPSPTESKPSSPDNNVLKKRMCTKNNDISSSLSSSLLINTPKRKLQDIQSRPAISERYLPTSGNLAQPQAKQQCNENNYVANPEYESTVAYPPELLTPLPPTPAVDSLLPAKVVVVPEKPKPAQSAPQKPKLTLFNKDYDATTISPLIDDLRQPQEEGIAGISFVKPKNKSPVLSGKNALIERVQSSKLSLMLSCLSGELNDSDDEVDAKVVEQPKEAVSIDLTKPETIEQSQPAAATIASDSIPKTTVSVAPTAISAAVMNLPATTTSTTEIATAPAFSFGLKPAEPISFGAIPITKPALAVTSTVTATVTNPPKAVTFSFGSKPTETKATEVTSALTAIAATPAPTFNFSAPQSAITTTSTSTPISSGFSFGQPMPSLTATATTVTMPSSTPSFAPAANPGTFSFGAPKPDAPPVATTTVPLSFSNPAPTFGVAAASENAAKPAFAFGATTSTPAPIMSSASFSTSLTPTSKPPMFGSNSFGGISTMSSSAPSQQSEPPAFGGFSSGGFNASTIRSPPKFGETANTFGTNTTSGNSSFNFGSTQQQPPKPAIATGMFGTAPPAPVVTTTNNTFGSGFGATDINKAVTSMPSFNFNPSAGGNPPPAFGTPTSALNQPASTFSFNAPTAATKPVATAASPFSFGGASQQSQNTSTGFGFGGSIDNKPPPAFGFANVSAQNAPQSQQAAKPFAFGGSSAESAFTAVQNKSVAPSPGGFAFNPAVTAAETKSIFGSAPTAPQTQQVTKSFSFTASSIGGGGSTEQQNVSASIFGSAATNNNSAGLSAFGAPATTPGKLFSFGGAPANNNNNNPTGVTNNPPQNLFGNQTVSSPPPPLFPAAANITPSAFGSAVNNSNKAPTQLFSFGGNSASSGNLANNSNTVGAFSFDSATKPDTNKLFGFGAVAGANVPQANVFSNAGAVKPQAFNFTGGAIGDTQSNNNLNPAAGPGTTNLFNPTSTGVDNTVRREIRTATRRLRQK